MSKGIVNEEKSYPKFLNTVFVIAAKTDVKKEGNKLKFNSKPHLTLLINP